MIALRLSDPCPWTGGYSSHCVGSWLPGEVREIPEAEAVRLLEQHPAFFSRVGPVSSREAHIEAADPRAIVAEVRRALAAPSAPAEPDPLPATAPAEAAPAKSRTRARRSE